jgi:hypothetical protein
MRESYSDRKIMKTVIIIMTIVIFFSLHNYVSFVLAIAYLKNMLWLANRDITIKNTLFALWKMFIEIKKRLK